MPLLLAVMFWTGLWGMVGLVLATPVTVCLAVLGKYVPQLGFLSVLLRREAALRPAARYYQRLLARDRTEAEAVVKEYLGDHPVEELFEHVLLPALVLVRRGRKAGELRPEDEEFILRTTQGIVDALAPGAAPSDPDAGPRVVVLGVPAADAVDETALHLCRHLARESGADLVVASGGLAAPDTAALVHGAAAVLVAALGPGGLTEARYLCRRIRAQHPEVKLLVGRWGGRNPKKSRRLLLAAGADRVVATIHEARTELTRLSQSAPPVHLPAHRSV